MTHLLCDFLLIREPQGSINLLASRTVFCVFASFGRPLSLHYFLRISQFKVPVNFSSPCTDYLVPFGSHMLSQLSHILLAKWFGL